MHFMILLMLMLACLSVEKASGGTQWQAMPLLSVRKCQLYLGNKLTPKSQWLNTTKVYPCPHSISTLGHLGAPQLIGAPRWTDGAPCLYLYHLKYADDSLVPVARK